MRRSAALAPLSRDHHRALAVAAGLVRCTPATARSCAELFTRFLDEHEQRHFALEEKLLLPELTVADRELALRVLEDHRALSDAARALREGSLEPTPELVRSLGTRLREHVRFEERSLFPRLESSLPAARLAQLGAALRAEA
ncbi:MAG TPA: hemerythrin domain-containing protein [Solirubrobacteraceae bacterium]|nr:hemerythrin domain-containing protein [Solirubrobacteraceae bacterium]